ncbi:ComEA family DNA-binding protein [Cellulomonas alba]|uniref:Helix-hairpin-helix domain-containing protein n=1 Tax=Cellulomonas alba TaxID=3053467 RepID=A0ABT7SC85_9CELL|nr:helix-hairpin-helix domain-containing protein [Cellulomonas alba]MDM7853797.1 helix-hairpin-helix domain-containing protein [Cellulomonas alba]
MRRRDRELAARRLAAAAAGARPGLRRLEDAPPAAVADVPSPAWARAAPTSSEARAPSSSGPATGGWIPERATRASAEPSGDVVPGAAGPLASATTPPAVEAPRSPAEPLAPAAAVRTLDALRHAADLYGGAGTAPDAASRPPDVPDRTSHPHATRWAVSPRAAAVGAVAIALVGGAVALHATTSSPGDPVDLPTPGAAATSAPTAAAEVVVDVVGEVAGPGVVRLPAGSRVVDAVAAAGGATRRAQLASLNLARVLVDGEQIVVPRRGAPPPAARATTAADALVDVNTADVAALDALPGIGPVLAQRIVDERAKHPFSSVDELADVPGIGPSLLARLRPLVRT